MSDAAGREKGEEGQMSKKIVIPLVVQNGTPMPVVAVGLLYPGDEVEWVSGALDVTLDFPSSNIFGDTTFKMPPTVTSMTLLVQPNAPHDSQENYKILDHGSGKAFPGVTLRTQPVMIFGP